MTEDSTNNQNESLSKSLKKIIDRHGHSYQYSVLRLGGKIFGKAFHPWHFEVSEFPVSVNGTDTHIDFILQISGIRFLLVCECKQVNRALSNWCFIRSPFVHRFGSSDRIIGESVFVDSDEGVRSRPVKMASPNKMYHIGYEVRSKETGDSKGKGRGAIDEAAAQVMRGVNGLVEFIAENPTLMDEKKNATIIPVIFTTANIWTTELDISNSDTSTGSLIDPITDLTEQEWIWYRFNQTPGLKHKVPTQGIKWDFGDILEQKYTRTIAIVNSSGIESFLTSEWWE